MTEMIYLTMECPGWECAIDWERTERERRHDVDASMTRTWRDAHLRAGQDHDEEIQEPIENNKYRSRDWAKIPPSQGTEPGIEKEFTWSSEIGAVERPHNDNKRMRHNIDTLDDHETLPWWRQGPMWETHSTSRAEFTVLALTEIHDKR